MNKAERIRYIRLLRAYDKEAAAKGVHFIIEEVVKNVWRVSVKGEEGCIEEIPTQRVAQLVHGLFLMGDQWRRRRLLGKSLFKTREKALIFAR